MAAQDKPREGAQEQRARRRHGGDAQAHERSIPDRLVLPELQVPTGRETRPHRHESRGIEGIDDQRDDGPVEKEVAEHEHGPGEDRAPAHGGSSAMVRRIRAVGSAKSASMAMATAEAAGQSRLLKNSSQSTLPIISVSGPPRSSGITNSPTAGMNTRSEPAATPGS